MIDKFELIGKVANADAKKFMGNPVNSYLVIKLLTKELQMFFDYFNSVQESKGKSFSRSMNILNHQNQNNKFNLFLVEIKEKKTKK